MEKLKVKVEISERFLKNIIIKDIPKEYQPKL